MYLGDVLYVLLPSYDHGVQKYLENLTEQHLWLQHTELCMTGLLLTVFEWVYCHWTKVVEQPRINLQGCELKPMQFINRTS